MRKMKRIITLVMAVVMMMAMSMTAFAERDVAGKTFTFTNVGAKEGTVSYFRVIKPDTTNTTGWNFVEESYGTAFVNALKGDNADFTAQDALDTLTADPNTTVEAARGTALQDIVDGLPENSNVWTTSEFKTVNDKFTLTLTEAGYYVVALSDKDNEYTYSLMSVSVAPSDLDNGTEEHRVKKTSNYVDKSIDESDKYVELNDTVEYTITSKVPYFYENKTDAYYKIYDKLSGAKFDSLSADKKTVTVSVKVGDAQATDWPATYTEATNSFVLDLTDLVKDPTTGKIVNTNAYEKVVITYTATVTNVEVANTSYPGYSENDPGDKYGDTETSFSGKVKVVKRDANTEEALNGAQFALAKETEDGTYVLATKNDANTITWTTTTYADSDAIIAAANAENSNVRTWKTAGQGDDAGLLTIEGLDRDFDYVVFEVVAPESYSINTLPNPVVFGEIINVEQVQEADDLTVLDTKLTNLPFTGGIGTTIFTVLGVAIMAMAAALFFATKKNANK